MCSDSGIGRKKVALGAVVLLKIRVQAEDLEDTISSLQTNMAGRYLSLFKRGNTGPENDITKLGRSTGV